MFRWYLVMTLLQIIFASIYFSIYFSYNPQIHSDFLRFFFPRHFHLLFSLNFSLSSFGMLFILTTWATSPVRLHDIWWNISLVSPTNCLSQWEILLCLLICFRALNNTFYVLESIKMEERCFFLCTLKKTHFHPRAKRILRIIMWHACKGLR